MATETGVSLLTELAKNGVAWTLVAILLLAITVIAITVYRAYIKSKAENHEQMLALIDKTDKIQAEVREDSLKREQLLMSELARLNDSIASIADSLKIQSMLLERNSDEIKEVKSDIKSVQQLVLVKNC